MVTVRLNAEVHSGVFQVLSLPAALESLSANVYYTVFLRRNASPCQVPFCTRVSALAIAASASGAMTW